MRLTSFLILWLLLTQNALAHPVMAVLEYHSDGVSQETGRLADRVREEFQRRYPGAVLSREETAAPFYYYKKGILKNRISTSRELEEGKRAYFELRWKDAERIFQDLIAQAEEETLVEAHVLLGLTHMAEKHDDQAEASFEKVLTLDPGYHLKREFFPPKFVKKFQKTARAFQPQTAGLFIDADPAGSEVYINGVLKGTTPLRLEKLPAGDHIVRIRANHYVPFLRKIHLSAGEAQSLRGRLSWISTGRTERFLGFSRSEAGSEERLTDLASQLGAEMGVAKVLFVSLQKNGRKQEAAMRLVDTELRSAHKPVVMPVTRIEETSAETSAALADRVTEQLKGDLKIQPERYAQNRYQGDVLLIGRYRKPLYKKPLFWVVVGGAAATAGIVGALAGGGAAVGTLGIIFQ